MLLSGNVALIGGNPTKPGPGYCALIKAALSLAVQVTRFFFWQFPAVTTVSYSQGPWPSRNGGRGQHPWATAGWQENGFKAGKPGRGIRMGARARRRVENQVSRKGGAEQSIWPKARGVPLR